MRYPTPILIGNTQSEEIPPVTDTQATRAFMQMILQQLVLVSADDLKVALDEAASSQSIWDAVGPILEPTRYRDMLYNGTFDHATVQADIVRHLIAIRELIDKMNGIAEKSRAKS